MNGYKVFGKKILPDIWENFRIENEELKIELNRV